ncbi:flagellar basal body-associated FliL family protein [Celeribacter indicus]|uniref:Flagellar protein FliL n=1 Tax=Celeribacter indicus TaxID=1208324 RepID=A0A0B5DVM5_9RHOB|nr:flagellar basal body-associated FliL family protein [Celeribacter indicus]AJE44816.1 flagellar basal body-associated protein FliL [Celeribacter indicus]SDX24375.1 hypothetical protein SAMN05443573_11879 [Celeribacter indicus]
MLKKLLPLILALVGLGAGIAGGLMLRPTPEVVPLASGGDSEAATPKSRPQEAERDREASFDYVKLNNQFVIPDLEDGKVTAMIVLSLSLETTTGTRETIYAREPKLRDAFLQVLFDHANTGGFRGAFTESRTMTNLRRALLEVAQNVIGPEVRDVLVMDIVRQDLG